MIIIVLQNTGTVETRVLLFTISMPRALLLLVALLAGFVLGMITGHRMGRPQRVKPAAAKGEGSGSP